jgi:flavin-dependent dehydrogenase
MSRQATSPTWDCIVVGDGPAGLNAAPVLGRARWRVLVLDSGSPRNYATHEMHGVLGHDGLDPRVHASRERPSRSTPWNRHRRGTGTDVPPTAARTRTRSDRSNAPRSGPS